MEYIQCPHCFKKYGVNDKVRAASGKTTRCKACSEAFEITIFSTPPASQETGETSEKEQTTPSEEAVNKNIEKEREQKSESKRDGNRLQIIITSTLGIVLIIALVVGYQFMDEPVKISQTQPAIESEKSILPVKEEKEQKSKTSQDEAGGDQTKKAKLAIPVISADGEYPGPPNPSNDCKQAATDQWFTDYMITNGNITSKEYIRLLDQSSSQTAEVLKLCKERYLASRVTEAAKLGKSPGWIKDEIAARSSSQYETGTNKETEW